MITLYEHAPPATKPVGQQLCQQIVKLTDDRMVHVGWSVYSLDQARDLVATIMAAIEIGERAAPVP